MDLVKHLKDSIDNAIDSKSKLTDNVLQIYGMSSNRNRHLLNNLVNIKGVNYLEIGVYWGSTFVSALYGNKYNHAYAIDNWSQFDGAPDMFKKNCTDFELQNYTLFEEDCFGVNIKKIKHKIGVYLYDGEHTEEASAQALTYYYDVFADEFILIVDDFDWYTVEDGTKRGIKECNLSVVHEEHLKAEFTNDWQTWWNGLYVAVLRKNNGNN